MDGARRHLYDRRVRIADWLFGALVVGFVSVLGYGAVVAGIDLSTRGSRTRALVESLVLGGGFFLLTDAWIGLCVPVAVFVLVTGGFSRSTEPSGR